MTGQQQSSESHVLTPGDPSVRLSRYRDLLPPGHAIERIGLRAWGGVTAHQRKEGRHLMEEPLVKPDRSTVAEPEISGWIEGPELTKPSLDDAAYHIKVNFHPMPSC